MNIFKRIFGPSTFVVAAFIGPGTITTCTIVGVKTSYSLLWVVVFSTITTIVFQEMAARLGFITQKGLGEAFDQHFQKGFIRFIVFSSVIGAILIGNAAYEAGNISGAILGANLLIGEFKIMPIIIGGSCFFLMYYGKYKWVERILISLVISMSFCFLITAIIVQPNLESLLKGFIPTQSSTRENLLLIMAIVGTTVVPYNLFLHASVISKKWKTGSSLKDIRIENAVSIIFGGLISILIVITAASSNLTERVESAKDLAVHLEPLFGQSAKGFMGIGLMAAGISSALTAPLAAAYAAKGLFSWPENETHTKFKFVWIIILVTGILISITEIKGILIIKFAQIANALFLPFIAIYLLYISNSKEIVKNFTNGPISNIFGIIIVIISIFLSLKSLNSIFAFI